MLTTARALPRGEAREAAAPGGRRPVSETSIVLALLGLGAALRFATLGAQSYWYDEAQAAHEVGQSFGAMVHGLLARETNPPLYFVLAWVWAHVFGTGEVALRSLSALAGVAVVGLCYGCGRELVSAQTGLVAAALAAVNPFLIWYSQEAREYMLLCALCAASLLAFARALRSGTARALAGWALLAALAVLTHFFAAALVWPEAVWLLAAHRRRALAAVTMIAAVQLTLLPFAFTHATTSLLGFIALTPLSMRIEQTPVAFALGSLSQTGLVSYGLLGAGVVLAAALVLLIGGTERRALRGAAIAAVLALAVLGLPLLAALAGHDFYIPRALIPAWVPLAVALAAACTARHARAAGAVLTVALLGLFVYGLVRVASDSAYQRPDWRGVGRALGHAGTARAIVLYDGGLATDPLEFYLPRVPWGAPPGPTPAVGEIDVVGSVWQDVRRPLPGGGTLVADRVEGRFRVVRVVLPAGRTMSPARAPLLAGHLLAPAPQGAAVLVQRAP